MCWQATDPTQVLLKDYHANMTQPIAIASAYSTIPRFVAQLDELESRRLEDLKGRLQAADGKGPSEVGRREGN